MVHTYTSTYGKQEPEEGLATDARMASSGVEQKTEERVEGTGEEG